MDRMLVEDWTLDSGVPGAPSNKNELLKVPLGYCRIVSYSRIRNDLIRRQSCSGCRGRYR